MADRVKLCREFKELGEAMGFIGPELNQFVRDSYDKHIEQERLEKEQERQGEIAKFKIEKELEKEKEIEKQKLEKEKEVEKQKLEKEKEIEKQKLEKEQEIEKQRLNLELEMKRLEIDDRERARRHELELKQKDLEAETASHTSSTPSTVITLPTFHVDAFNDRQDAMDAYLDRFERIATEYNLPEDKWCWKLSQSLRGRAYEVYQKLPSDRGDDYDYLKQALLVRYELTADAYRTKFRSAKRDRGESYSQYKDRLGGYFEKWVSLHYPAQKKTMTG